MWVEEMRGEWDWVRMVRWDMNLKERNVFLFVDFLDGFLYLV